MIGYLRGKVLENNEGHVLLAIGSEAGGSIGYSVTVPHSPTYLDCVEGCTIEFFVYTHVREEALDLYGFLSRAEKELFLTLLEVNGIGPRVAIGILSKIEPARLIQAIAEEDKEALIKMPGIGKKTAERVVVELSDKIKKKLEREWRGTPTERPTGATAAPGAKAEPGEARLLKDARDALLGLGYREQEVTPILRKAMESSQQKPGRAEDLVKAALRLMI